MCQLGRNTTKVVKTLPLDYIGGLVRDPGGTIRAIDTGDWKVHTLSVPGLVVTNTAPHPLPARVMVVDEKSGDTWAGNSDTHRLVKISKKTGETRDIAPVDFPLGVAIIRAEAR